MGGSFDTVCFLYILTKLKLYQIGGKIYDWLGDWTDNRPQRVILYGVESTWIAVTSSGVQGSVKGPYIFQMFINYLDVDIANANKGKKTDLFKFVDDSNIGRIIKY